MIVGPDDGPERIVGQCLIEHQIQIVGCGIMVRIRKAVGIDKVGPRGSQAAGLLIHLDTKPSMEPPHMDGQWHWPIVAEGSSARKAGLPGTSGLQGPHRPWRAGFRYDGFLRYRHKI